MEARLNYFGSDIATKFVRYINSAGIATCRTRSPRRRCRRQSSG